MARLAYLAALVPAALGAVHEVAVGASGLTFEPANVEAAVGDYIVYTLSATHDVVSSNFNSPCVANGDWYSGTYASSQGGALRYVVNVTSTDPVYLYCSVARHCQSGMVGGVNLPSGNQGLDAYSAAAASASRATTPSGGPAGGRQLTAQQVAALDSNGGGADESASPSSSAASPTRTGASATAASSTPTGAASVLSMDVSAILAGVGVLLAWLY